VDWQANKAMLSREVVDFRVGRGTVVTVRIL
jgi:hypothetical protein